MNVSQGSEDDKRLKMNGFISQGSQGMSMGNSASNNPSMGVSTSSSKGMSASQPTMSIQPVAPAQQLPIIAPTAPIRNTSILPAPLAVSKDLVQNPFISQGPQTSPIPTVPINPIADSNQPVGLLPARKNLLDFWNTPNNF